MKATIACFLHNSVSNILSMPFVILWRILSFEYWFKYVLIEDHKNPNKNKQPQ